MVAPQVTEIRPKDVGAATPWSITTSDKTWVSMGSYPAAEVSSKPEAGLLARPTDCRSITEAKLLRAPRPKLRGTWATRETFFRCCSDKRLSGNREAMVDGASTRMTGFRQCTKRKCQEAECKEIGPNLRQCSIETNLRDLVSVLR